MIPSRLTKSAKADIAKAGRRYENQRAGLGDAFLDRVEEAIEKIERNPKGYAVAFEGLRQCQLRQFPYALWFELRPDNSLIIACLAGKRDRRLIQERLKGVIEMPGPE